MILEKRIGEHPIRLEIQSPVKIREKDYPNFEKMENLLKQYDPKLLNTKPASEKELWSYYYHHSQNAVEYIRLIVRNNSKSLSNEIRAMLGHLTEYRIDEHGRVEIEKAYGHFRRLNLDVFKMICDELDLLLYSWLRKCYKYDYKNVITDFPEKYAEKYVAAKKAYMEAQISESTGSDSLTGTNIIEKYYNAAMLYIDCFQCYRKNYGVIRKQYLPKMIWVRVWLIIGVAEIIGSVIMNLVH